MIFLFSYFVHDEKLYFFVQIKKNMFFMRDFLRENIVRYQFTGKNWVKCDFYALLTNKVN